VVPREPEAIEVEVVNERVVKAGRGGAKAATLASRVAATKTRMEASLNIISSLAGVDKCQDKEWHHGRDRSLKR
jgi:hypothetical protein